ncbi:prenylated flavin chaperone LpdD [Alloscardovia macacae]|uniref:Prenylated flavin chaperone LpdD-like domain-containing protein n=1 Tax=Alloscardovia macacae TaxID=1160091 RepID=A0A261F780_9BIFI|nr:hypothetical protein [Alloscardovia macacae]OZG54944.1 hypothetical protein ALMA_0269 [Alloscardovia macacae]
MNPSEGELHRTRGCVTVQARIRRVNADVRVELTGGDVPHLGVVTMVDAHGEMTTHAFASRPGRVHQEGVLTEKMAAVLAAHVSGNLIILAGVHVQNITAEQMEDVFRATDELTADVALWLDEHPAQVLTERFSPAHPRT